VSVAAGASPTIAVVGVGAIGGAMAAALGDAGHQAALCVRTPFDRLSRDLEGQVTRYEHTVHTTAPGGAPVDWLLLCTKTYQIEAARHWLDALVGPATRVAVMQNGVDHAARVAPWVPAERAVPCIILLPAHADSPGRVVQQRVGTVQVPDDAAGTALAALFDGQDAVLFEPTRDFLSAVWSKLVLNAVGGAVCALALTPLRGAASPRVGELVAGLVREVVEVGRAEGATLADDLAERTIEKFRGPVGSHWTSMAADRRDGRPMEWEARNAVVGRIGRRHGIATPLNDAVTELLALADEGAGTR